MKSVIGIDLGGTTIKGAVMSVEGKLVEIMRVPTEAEKGVAHVLQNILELIDKLLSKCDKVDVAGVGIGTPGFVDEQGVIVGGGEQLPGWKGTNLYLPIKERFGLNASAANDVTAVALAELLYGAGRGVSNLVCFALGTGIGGGIVTGGKVYKGTHGMAGEIGHIVVETNGIECNCGQFGCVERYASATGIVNKARLLTQMGGYTETPFALEIRKNPEALTAKMVYDKVAEGDPLAVATHVYICDMLGRAVGILLNTMSPDRVVLGGGVMQAGDIILNEVKKATAKYCWPAIYERCDIVKAELGEDAGVVGAASLAVESFT